MTLIGSTKVLWLFLGDSENQPTALQSEPNFDWLFATTSKSVRPPVTPLASSPQPRRLLLSPHDSQPRVPVRRIVGLPEEEEALATERSSGNIRDAVSPVAEMFRPVGLLLHSQSVPSFDNYGNGSAPPPPEAPTINEEKEEEGDELSNLPPKPPPRKNLLPGPSGELKKRE